MPGRTRLLLALALLTTGFVAPVATPTPAQGEGTGWVVDSVRLEPVDAVSIPLAGLGEFRGAIEVRRGPAGVAVINELALEDYLLGISEVPVSWPLEAQKAQAIAARTYALYEAGRTVNAAHRAAGADICATQACQVYVGVEKERRPGSAAWAAAVEATRGQVIQHQGRPILAKYSSSNGGRSVAGGHPYLRSVDDPDDRYSPLHRWRPVYSLPDVARALGLATVPMDVRRSGDTVVITSVDATDPTAVVPAQQTMPAADFRSRMNAALPAPAGLPAAVPSIRFDLVTADGAVAVDGRGWGHGVGMSQYGALGKALRGLRAEDILAAYYGGLRPSTVPTDRTLKVAVDLSASTVTVAPSKSRFRVTDGAGTVLAHAAAGAWSIAPAEKGRLRVVPAGADGASPTATVVETEPTQPAPGAPLTVRLQLDGPAAVTRLELTPPDGPPVEVSPAMLRPSGLLTVHVARPAATTGTYRLHVERDAGGGRAATSVLAVDVSSPGVEPARPVARTATPVGGADAGDATRLPALLALLLLAGVGFLTIRVGHAARRPVH